jgi:hypothetical protein
MPFESDQIVTSTPEVGNRGLTTLVLNGKCVARLFGKSTSWFYLHRPELEEAGFPVRDPLLGGWSSIAVLNWFDLRNRERPIRHSPAPTWGRGLRGKEYSRAHLD